jgi:tetratricopeptide (TPR) repeat protein
MIGTKSTPRNLVIALAGAVACLSFPAVARAQNAPAVEKLIQMNKKALDDYETLEWDSAKRTLLQALVFGKKSNLETHPMMARTYVHLGAVYIVGFNDKQKGLQSFQRALEIDPTIHIAKAMSTPELEEVFAQANRGAGGGGGAAAGPGHRGGATAVAIVLLEWWPPPARTDHGVGAATAAAQARRGRRLRAGSAGAYQRARVPDQG